MIRSGTVLILKYLSWDKRERLIYGDLVGISLRFGYMRVLGMFTKKINL